MYKKLESLSKNIATLTSIENLLSWDQEVYMPKEGIEFRALQLELLAPLIHKQRTSPAFKKTLSSMIDLETGAILATSLSAPQIAALKAWRRDLNHLIKLPPAFVKKFAATTSRAQHAWIAAKQKNNFKEFLPHLKKIVDLCRKKADYLGFQEHPYDALLDLYEPEMTAAKISPLFETIKTPLSELLKKIQLSAPIDNQFLRQEFPKDQQFAFGHQLLSAMGFRPETSRLDLSSHPFCAGIAPHDLRMTTRIDLHDPMSNLFSIIHEGGHGLYDMGLPKEHFGTPLGEAISLGIHESQSRFWETRIGRSLPFWSYFYPLFQKEFPEQLGSHSLQEFHRAINRVQASFIRVEADEVTYSLHIILRFEIEKQLIEGSLKPEKIPDMWNQKMEELLGITPPSDKEGCLQDIHWSMGGFGYFPTYTLGNLYASQLFSTFEKVHPDWKQRVASGNLSFIREWLRQEVHQWGRQYLPEELMIKVTGEPLKAGYFISYLQEKFHSLYEPRP